MKFFYSTPKAASNLDLWLARRKYLAVSMSKSPFMTNLRFSIWTKNSTWELWEFFCNNFEWARLRNDDCYILDGKTSLYKFRARTHTDARTFWGHFFVCAFHICKLLVKLLLQHYEFIERSPIFRHWEKHDWDWLRI